MTQQLPIPVQVGSSPPERWDEIEAQQQSLGENASSWLRNQRRPTVAAPQVDWSGLGFEPRWVGFDSADCAAALSPSIYSGHGANEFTRFRSGASRRSETALVVSPIGRSDAEPADFLLGYDDSVSVGGGSYTSIIARRIGKGARVQAAPNLVGADLQLARSILSLPKSPLWHALTLNGAVLETIYGRQEQDPDGVLQPIIETELGEPVVALWLADDGIERRYIVPTETPWSLLLRWLSDQALPEFVPNALRRARRPLASDDELMTVRERRARSALAEFDAEHRRRRDELEMELSEAERSATTIREELLYGTGGLLVGAVRSVLEAADVAVVDLDEALGGTKNADLLCTYAGQVKLVEVKSAVGSAPERAYQDLLRHMREWLTLPGAVPIEGGALILSHELRKSPRDRSVAPFSRPEFLAAQLEPVISIMQLFEAWRNENFHVVRQLLFREVNESVVEPGGNQRSDAATQSEATRRGRWRLRGQG